jgi:hypothetical protein
VRPFRRWLEDRGSRQRVVFFLAVASFCVAIVYTDVQTYDPKLTPATGFTDTKDYLDMYFGGTGSGIRAARPLVPILARAVPPLPHSLFGSGHSFTPQLEAVARFGVVNLLFLFFACVALFVLEKGFGLSDNLAYLGVLLFLGTETVVRGAGLPMSDPAFYLFFLLALIAVQRNNWWLLLGACTVGVAAKELVLLVIPMILLAEYPWRRRGLLLIATIPAIAVYAWIRIAYAPVAADPILSETGIAPLGYLGQSLRALTSVNGLVNLAMAFGFAWAAAILGFWKADVPRLLRRWSLLLPITLVGTVFGGGNFARAMFSAFPVVIPLAALGFGWWISLGREVNDSA